MEPEEAFASRIAVQGAYCLVAIRADVPVAYLLAHRWKRQSPPPLGTVLKGEPEGDVLFIHDLAACPTERGSGVGQALVMHVFDLAARDGLRAAELIAVQGAARYWRTLGFVDGDISAGLSAKIASYGSDARWMMRDVPQP
jgi:GNAT superfamily N-acetyltransferase